MKYILEIGRPGYAGFITPEGGISADESKARTFDTAEEAARFAEGVRRGFKLPAKWGPRIKRLQQKPERNAGRNETHN